MATPHSTAKNKKIRNKDKICNKLENGHASESMWIYCRFSWPHVMYPYDLVSHSFHVWLHAVSTGSSMEQCFTETVGHWRQPPQPRSTAAYQCFLKGFLKFPLELIFLAKTWNIGHLLTSEHLQFFKIKLKAIRHHSDFYFWKYLTPEEICADLVMAVEQ